MKRLSREYRWKLFVMTIDGREDFLGQFGSDASSCSHYIAFYNCMPRLNGNLDLLTLREAAFDRFSRMMCDRSVICFS